MLRVLAMLALTSAPLSPFLPKVRPYHVSHYRLEFRLAEGGTFEGKVQLTLKAKTPLSTVELDAFGLDIHGAKISGAPATTTLHQAPATETGTVVLKPAKAIAAGKEVMVELAYSGRAGRQNHGLFVTDSPTQGGLPQYFLDLEPQFAQRFFPCNDQPDDKATTEIVAVVDGRYQVLSNGIKVEDEAFAEGGLNLRRVHWKQEQPHSTYLVTLAVGQWDSVPVEGEVPATVWVPRGSAPLAQAAAEMTSKVLRSEAAFLRVKYPWAKYDQVAVPGYAWGAMENTSLVMVRLSDLVLGHRNYLPGRPTIEALIAHEAAHQWFGNLVTLKWWDDTWLNEGFANYLGEITEEEYDGNDRVQADRVWSSFVDYVHEEASPRSHPLVGKLAPTTEGVFDSTSYQKGAHVLRMLETFIGREPMRQGLKSYLELYHHANATSEQFFAAIAKSAHQNLTGFKDSWLKKKGYPVLTPSWTFANGVASLTVRQVPATRGETGPFVFKLPVVLHRDNEPSYHQEQVLLIDRAEVKLEVPLPAAPQWVDWNRGASALATVDRAAVPEQQWILAARHDPDTSWRLLSQFALMGELVAPAVEHESLPSDAAYAALLETLENDPSPYVRQQALRRLGRSVWKRLPASLGKPTLALAKHPVGLPDDPIGKVQVRRAAMELLGKIDYPEGRAYLLEEVVKPDLDLNFLGSLATGTARLGDSEAIATLGQTTRAQRERGAPYVDAASEALGAVANPEVLPQIAELLASGAPSEEALRRLFRNLNQNQPLKVAPSCPRVVRDFVLDNKVYSNDVKVDLLQMLDEQKSPEAKGALSEIAQSASSTWVRGAAAQILDHAASLAPAPAVPGPKKTKRGTPVGP